MKFFFETILAIEVIYFNFRDEWNSRLSDVLNSPSGYFFPILRKPHLRNKIKSRFF